MNQALKQRLVGAVVLVALAVIFLPALFNGGRPKQLGTLKEVPAMPQVAPLLIQEPLPAKGSSDAPAVPASDMYAMEPKSTSTFEKIKNVTSTVAPAAQPGLNNKGIPNAWVLQVGVFSDKTKADALKKSLQAKGYRAFTRTIAHDKNSPDKKNITRVMIGPELEQSAVTKMKLVVDKEFAVKSIVVKFES